MPLLKKRYTKGAIFDRDKGICQYSGKKLSKKHCRNISESLKGHPGAWLGTFTSDGSGVISSSNNVNLGMNLPHPNDDNYLSGAKIWLVLAADYDTGTKAMTAWNPTQYLFEHEPIGYSDCDITTVPCWLAPLIGSAITTDLVILPQTNIDLIFCYNFAINITPDTYTITTKAVPVV